MLSKPMSPLCAATYLDVSLVGVQKCAYLELLDHLAYSVWYPACTGESSSAPGEKYYVNKHHFKQYGQWDYHWCIRIKKQTAET